MKITNQAKEIEPQAVFLSIKDKTIVAVIDEQVGRDGVFTVQEGAQVAAKSVIIPLGTAAGGSLGIIENAVSIFGKIILLPRVSTIPVIEVWRHFVSALITEIYPHKKTRRGTHPMERRGGCCWTYYDSTRQFCQSRFEQQPKNTARILTSEPSC